MLREGVAEEIWHPRRAQQPHSLRTALATCPAQHAHRSRRTGRAAGLPLRHSAPKHHNSPSKNPAACKSSSRPCAVARFDGVEVELLLYTPFLPSRRHLSQQDQAIGHCHHSSTSSQSSIHPSIHPLNPFLSNITSIASHQVISSNQGREQGRSKGAQKMSSYCTSFITSITFRTSSPAYIFRSLGVGQWGSFMADTIGARMQERW